MGTKTSIGGGEEVNRLLDIPMSKEDKLAILKMCEDDIKCNKIAFKKKTSIAYVKQVLETSITVYRMVKYG